MAYDLVVRGGTVIDGSGVPGALADVAIVAGKIAEVGTNLDGKVEVDASGLVVAPGFIDIHTHYDAQVFWDPWLTPSSHHGVTSVIAGNCGFSIAPVRADDVPLLARTLQGVEDMSFDTLMAGVPWDEFESFATYLDAVERRGVGLNFGAYVGHTALRIHAMGDAAYEREATPAEVATMQSLVGDALGAGAIGVASSDSASHFGDGGRPVPSRRATPAELRSILEPLTAEGRGVVALFPQNPARPDELFKLQAAISRPMTWTALLTTKRSAYHERVMDAHAAARARGIEVMPQVSCRPLVFRMTLLDPYPFNSQAAFARLAGLTRSERTAAYRDFEWRRAARDELAAAKLSFDWASVSVAESRTRPDLEGCRVLDLIGPDAESAIDVMLNCALADDLATRFEVVLANDDEDGIKWLLQRDDVLLGLADSGAHVSQICDACFATDLLGNWVREREVMPLEQAVHKLTEQPARFLGLGDRGRLAPGMAADICAFDPLTIAPGPIRRVHDFPANGERLTADEPVGVVHVLVNGSAIRRDGAATDPGAPRPGQILGR